MQTTLQELSLLELPLPAQSFTNWLYNISTKFDVESVTISDSSVPSYSVVTIAKNNFRVGDSRILLRQ